MEVVAMGARKISPIRRAEIIEKIARYDLTPTQAAERFGLPKGTAHKLRQEALAMDRLAVKQ
jgi:hypothetical protein